MEGMWRVFSVSVPVLVAREDRRLVKIDDHGSREGHVVHPVG